jgi:hypothetical protein
MAYLNPFAVEDPPKSPKRVVQRDDLQPLLPGFRGEEGLR